MTISYKDSTLERCSQLNSRTKVQCGAAEYIPGTRKCYKHGSTQLGQVHKAVRKIGWEKVLSEVEQKYYPAHNPNSDVVVFGNNPFDTLMQTMNETMEFKELLMRKIEKMGDEEVEWRYEDKAGGEQLRSEVALYERALDRTVRCATALSKLNIEERYLKLSEKQASMIIYVLRQVLKRMDLKERQDEAADLVTQVIREIMDSPSTHRL